MKKNKKPFIVVTTGGSGGHIFPAESICSSLIKKGCEVVFVTDKRGKNFQSLPNVKTYNLMAEAISKRTIIQKIIGMFKLFCGAAQAMILLNKLKPDAIVGVGGYASFPAGLAGQMLGIDVILHEQNAVLGRANRILAKNAKLIATSFNPTKFLPDDVMHIQTGMPARAQILKKQNTPYVPATDEFNLLIFGGSQGSSFFSRTFPTALLLLKDETKAKINITQQARGEDVAYLQRQYQNQGFKSVTIQPFFDNMPNLLAQSHLIVARGGASTITELEIIGRPAMIIPLPTAVDNHQHENAKQFCDNGAGWLIRQEGFEASAVRDRIENLIAKPDILTDCAKCAYALNKATASDDVADEILKIITDKNKD